MNFTLILLLLICFIELFMLVCLGMFFGRLKRSEQLVDSLQNNQKALLQRIQQNAELEQEVVESFSQRQDQLRLLDLQLETKIEELNRLLIQADEVQRSPQVLREVIADGHKRGQTIAQLSRATGLSADEVELILVQIRKGK